MKTKAIFVAGMFIILTWGLTATIGYAFQTDLSDSHIIPETEYLFDETGKLGLVDLMGPEKTSAFKIHHGSKFKFGILSKVLWLRFKIESPFNRKDSRLMMLGIDKPFSYVDLYLPVARAEPLTYHVVTAGFLQEKTGPVLNHRYSAFQLPLDLPAHQYIYLRIKPFSSHDSAALNFSLFIESQVRFYQKTRLEFAFYGLVVGVMGAMIFYNLFLYIVLKDRLYLLYLLYIFFTLFYLFFRTGIINMIGLSRLKSATIPSVAIALFFGSLFSQAFLETWRYCTVYDKFIRGCIVGSIVVVLGILMGRPREANILIHLLGLGGPIVLAMTAFQRVRQGYAPARTYLAAWALLLIGTISIASIGLGLLPSTFLTTHAVFMGSAIESVLLSIALAQRISDLRREKEVLKKREQHLERLSKTDALTGLYNKRWFSEALEVEIHNCRQSSIPLSLIVADIDNFKKFNDTFGHALGDNVLALLGGLLSSSIRESDIACRYGGEEFCIILPGTGIDKAVNLAERIREKFGQVAIQTDLAQNKTHATISIGVAELMVDESGKELFVRADKALYQAKSRGRNRVAVPVQEGA